MESQQTLLFKRVFILLIMLLTYSGISYGQPKKSFNFFRSKTRIAACTVPPVITCPADFHACPGVSTGPGNTGFASAIPGGPNCSPPLISFKDDVISSGPCVGATEINRVWTATDPQDPLLNSSCLQKIILKDDEPPTIINCPRDTSVMANSNCYANVFWNPPSVFDNCGKLFLTASHISGDQFPIGVTQVSYNAEDPCANKSNCIFNITVIGSCCDTPPLITCPADYSGCPNDGLDPSVTGQLSVSPGSSRCNPPVYRYRDSVLFRGNCPGEISLIRIWEAFDPIDTTKYAFCLQTIELKDDSAPLISCCPADITVSPGINCKTTVHWKAPAVSDGCSGVILQSNIASGSSFNVGTNNILYTATDVCGKSASCSFTITVSECCNVNPKLKCPADFVACPGSSLDPSQTGKAIADPGNPGCADPIIKFEDLKISEGSCNGAVHIVRIWTATDPNDPNLKSTCLQSIQLKDSIAPIFISGPRDTFVSIDTITCQAIVNWNEPVVMDNCKIASVTSNYKSGAAFSPGLNAVIYTAIDSCGNISSYSFKILVTGNCCNKPPVIKCPTDYYGCPEANCNPSRSGTATAIPGSVSCEIPIITYSDVLIKNYSCLNAKRFKRIWRATDPKNSQLFSECTQIIDLNDTTAPVFTYCTPDITVDAKGDCEATAWWNPPIAIDNCGIKQMTSNYKPGAIFPAGTTIVVYSAYDHCGNLTNHSFKVTVLGNGLKIHCPPNITVDKDPNLNGAIVNWNHPTVSTCKPCKDSLAGFVYMGTYLGNRYFCSRQTATWPDAKYICESVGGKLCVMNSLDENQWVASKLMGQTAYIGLHDSRVEGLFEWVDGSPLLFTNWYAGQPNDANGNQDYVELIPDGTWNDQYNSTTREFICKMPCYTLKQIEGPPCGSLFPCGTTKVTYVAYQGSVTDTCSFYVTVNCNNTYCASKGSDCSLMWIQCVKLANVDNCSGPNGGYKYFPNPCIEVITGETYNLCLTPGYSGTAYTAYWKVWIDFNGDGDFEDSGELFAYGYGNTRICGNVTIPGCTPKSTRMRVSMSYGSYPPNSCCNFSYGEVEDYCINIANNFNGGTSNLLLENKILYQLLCSENCADSKIEDGTLPTDQPDEIIKLENQLIAFPNPATNSISISLKSSSLRSIRIFNNQGKQAEYIQFENALKVHSIDIRNWPEGLYVIQAEDFNGKKYAGKFELIR